MSTSSIFLILLVLTLISFVSGRSQAVSTVSGQTKRLHSRPGYYGYFAALCCAIPALVIASIWATLEDGIAASLALSSLPEALRNADASALSLIGNDIRNLATGNIIARTPEPWLIEAAENYTSSQNTSKIAMLAVVLAVFSASFVWTHRKISPSLRARNSVERIVLVVLMLCSGIAILTTIGIVFSLLFETARFFTKVPFLDFVFGLEWSPQTALRADQVGSTGLFGAIPLFAGTLLISFLAMCVATPVGLMAAIYMAEYAPSKIRSSVKPVLEILAGIPTVVYGFFAALTVAPVFREAGESAGLIISSESALVAGGVMGIMLIPFVSSLSDDVINAVPQSLREGSYGLGATQSETIRQVILPAALPGIVGSLLLATSRAIGETMIVVMAAGLSANMTVNPLEAVTTVTVQIVTLLVGDQEFDSAKTLAAFALGLMLFVVTLILNIIALITVNRYREQYD